MFDLLCSLKAELKHERRQSLVESLLAPLSKAGRKLTQGKQNW